VKTIARLKQTFNAQLEEVRRECEEEARGRNTCMQQMRNLMMDLDPVAFKVRDRGLDEG